MEEMGIIGQLGLDWKLFLSQVVNFFILLLILRAFVYKPLLLVIKERNKRIEEGLQKAKEADIRLKEVDIIAKGKIKEAEGESIEIIKATEVRAQQLEQSLQKKSEAHQKEVMAQLLQDKERQMQEAKQEIVKKAGELIKAFIVKTVELAPKDIDDALISKAVSAVKDSNEV